MKHKERHYTHRVGWLRAAVLGANDGMVSTASLLIGLAAARASHQELLAAGVAGLVAGAMSMAAGEYVSVSSQADTESADLARERAELKSEPERELRELANLYVGRGVELALATQVAGQLMQHDALDAHARDELGILEMQVARPIQAALSSAATFALGAALPLLTVCLAPSAHVIPVVGVTSCACLVLLGVLSARAGGARIPVAVARVTFWGLLAMAVTAAIGHLFGAVV